MIKIALALHHKILPPTININEPHPQLDIENSPFYLNTETRPWIRGEHPRRAGVSAFGFGGTNFHVVLEEYESEQRTPYRLHRHAQTLVLHAPTSEALRVRVQDLHSQLQSPNAERDYAHAVEASSNMIPHGNARLAFVANSLVEARDLLGLAMEQLQTRVTEPTWQHPKGIFYRRQALDGKVVALFSGQGAQHVEMGRELMLNFPVLREAFTKVDALFAPMENAGLASSFSAPTPGTDSQAEQTEALQRTDYAQPAIGAMSAGLYQLFTAAGFRADFVAGHSFGELTALWAAGVLDEPTYFQLMKARGASMSPPAHPGFDAGTMLAVVGTYAQLQNELPHLPGVYLANWNSHDQVVLAGPTSAIEAAQSTLQNKGYSVTRLPVAAAFHTPLVGHAQQPFAVAIHAAKFNSPSCRCTPTQLPNLTHLTPVRYRNNSRSICFSRYSLLSKSKTCMLPAAHCLLSLVRETFSPSGQKHFSGPPAFGGGIDVGKQKDSDRQLREAVAQLRVAGLQLREIDPFAAISKPAEIKPKRAMNVQLNGSNYVSDRTRSSYENALQQPAPEVDEVSVISATPAVTPAVQSPDYSSALHADIIAQFVQQQAEAARIHEQYLRQHAEHTQALLKLLGDENPLLLV